MLIIIRRIIIIVMIAISIGIITHSIITTIASTITI